MLQALLLAIWAGLCTWDQFGPHLGFRKPLLASVGVGIILGLHRPNQNKKTLSHR